MAASLLLTMALCIGIVTTASACSEGDLELLPPESPNENTEFGFIEYCFRGRWRPKCANDNWNQEAAKVACRQLGFSDQGATANFGHNEEYNTSKVMEVNHCEGTENSLQECGVIGGSSCTAKNHGQLKCEPEFYTSNIQGRVEACLNGQWGTVQTSQPQTVAEAVCHTFSAILMSPSSPSGYRQAKPVYNCSVTSTYSGKLDCHSMSHTTDHSMDLGASCYLQPNFIDYCEPDGQFRLGERSNNGEGRVEVCGNGQWRTVGNVNKEITAAVCSKLGFMNITLIRFDLEETERYCCYNDTNSTLECHPCNQNEYNQSMYTGVQCLEQVIEQTVVEAPSKAMGTESDSITNLIENENVSTVNTATVLGAVIGVSLAMLIATITGWAFTCAVLYKKSAALHKLNKVKPLQHTLCRNNLKEICIHRNECYSLQHIEPNKATHTQSNYLEPAYEIVPSSTKDVDYYNVLSKKSPAY